MGLKQVKCDAFDVLFVILDVKQCTRAILEDKQENGLKTS